LDYLYFPGCTLKGSSAWQMENTALEAVACLGLNLQELKQWQCCGAVYPLSEEEIITLVSPARALYAAAESGKPLVSLCSACHHVLKRTQVRLLNDKETREKISCYLEEDYPGEARVLHYLELLRDEVGWQALKEKVKNPLQGRRIAAYYGCMLLRPSREMCFDNPERPRIMEDFINTLGAEVVNYPFRIRCCGAYLAVTENRVAEDASRKIVKMALDSGAEEMTTACPLCRYNLEKTPEAKQGKVKISYFSEPLSEALNLEVQEVEP